MKGTLRKRLEKINKLFEKIEELESEFTLEERRWMLDFHNHDSTLQYCARWGLSGTTELLENICVCERCDKEWIEMDDLDRVVCDDCLEEEKEEEE